MTVQQATQSVLSLSGVLDVCGCADNALLKAGVVSLNRARQTLQLSPTHSFATQEFISLLLSPSDVPVNLPVSVQSVVGRIRVLQGASDQLGPEIRMCATQSEFQNYFLSYGIEPLGLYDDVRVVTDHEPGSGDWFKTEIWLPLWEGWSLLIYFDNSGGAYEPHWDTGFSWNNYPISRSTVPVRVILPNVYTQDVAIIEALRKAILTQASQYLSCQVIDDQMGLRLTRRRAGDILSIRATLPLGLLTRGPRYPVISYVGTSRNPDEESNELCRAYVHFAPYPLGSTAVITAIAEAPLWTVNDVGCGEGLPPSPEIPIAHNYCESLLLPLARFAFAQDYPHYLSKRSMEMMASLQTAADAAREALGLSIPSAGQNVQRNQVASYAHP